MPFCMCGAGVYQHSTAGALTIMWQRLIVSALPESTQVCRLLCVPWWWCACWCHVGYKHAEFLPCNKNTRSVATQQAGLVTTAALAQVSSSPAWCCWRCVWLWLGSALAHIFLAHPLPPHLGWLFRVALLLQSASVLAAFCVVRACEDAKLNPATCVAAAACFAKAGACPFLCSVQGRAGV